MCAPALGLSSLLWHKASHESAAVGIQPGIVKGCLSAGSRHASLQQHCALLQTQALLTLTPSAAPSCMVSLFRL